ncbi:MAG: tRNA (guanosine(18)-2'-O)-methyltransferase [uncultured Thermomicrobiales bacterium]|uniref:tRNA (guanosine(18)-2'-O)-methyltransferase n=1 Tax=uncultured Thermomicrobiales bacterium TaxID=1645740 RepID=A0A6J4UB79_9BACT|nr:MAG: tRNA (guanosine(18)-2'-O)-methyltransferase [uncultured Thermomicrobiales bacterium]
MTDRPSASASSRPIPPAQRNGLLDEPGPVKTSRWPRTSRRQERIDDVLGRRQPSLTIVLEDVHDQWNASAVLRSCDAVGVLDVHLVYVNDPPPRKAFDRKTSGSAAKWVALHTHTSIETCYEYLRERGFTIFASALRADSQDVYEVNFRQPTALVLGNEKRGVSDLAADWADGTYLIPMHGMVESLNISVACAVSLYEALRQRRAAGMYETPGLGPDALGQMREEWLRK